PQPKVSPPCHPKNPLVFLPLTTNRRLCPLTKSITVLDNLHRHLVVSLERMFCVGAERFHFPLSIFADRRFINFKIQLSLVKDAEKGFVFIEPMAAEHPSRLDIIQFSQLIEHKILE